MSFRARWILSVLGCTLCVAGALVVVADLPADTPAPAAAREVSERAAGRQSATPAARSATGVGAPVGTLVSADLTPDGADRYLYQVGGGARPVTAGRRALADQPDLVVAAPATNQGVNLRSVMWFDGVAPATDAESCATSAESTGPIAQAGVALRVRQVPGGVQAVTVTNNILFGARNGWNVHLWDGTGRGRIIGQMVLTHSFGPTVFQSPPLPWRLCARVVGEVLQFKAWSLAVDATEPDWTDPGYGSSFSLPDGWVYPGHAGWYVGHLVGGDQAAYRDLQAGALALSAPERVAVIGGTGANEVMRSVAAALAAAVPPA